MSRKHRGRVQGEAVTNRLPAPAGGVHLETFVPWTFVKRGWRKEVITPPDAPEQLAEAARCERPAQDNAKDTPLLRALGLAFHWQRLLDEGRFGSVTEIAAAEELDAGRASRIGRLAQLAPNIVATVAAGTAPEIALEGLVHRPLPISWDEQRRRVRSV